LLKRKQARKQPEKIALDALDWGSPVMHSEISQIHDGQLYYRGQRIEDLMSSHSLEDVMALLWGLDSQAFKSGLSQIAESSLPLKLPAPGGLDSELDWFEELQCLLPWLAAHDPQALNLDAEGVQKSCWRLLHWIWSLASRNPGHSSQHPGSLLTRFTAQLPADAQQELLRVMLILSADHELNVSTFSARCVASARGTPHAAIIAALAALSGRRHGGQTRWVEQFVNHCQQASSPQQGVRRWLQQQDQIPGFGHPLYPAGDPRWSLFQQSLHQLFPQDPVTAAAQAIAEAVESSCGLTPSLDFALVTTQKILKFPQRTALDLFALGRLPGWLAHIQEQYQQASLIRPRAAP